MLSVDAVALAPDQIPINEFAMFIAPNQVRTGIDRTDDVFYHGAIAGLEVRW